ncbi:SWIM zinc finger family protein [Vacuolonema iberomarrocanum]|uniref:SWIM zinc finger family protein n=1 Tax=Vacuolonema iberomarrocanum TaxID=3454632 RepID=UPI001A0C60DD|nr:SWIM zinc finger family protein [filamentous cyanobacterium LEGE 07170]
MMMWTSEQVLALAPDANSAKRGKSLANVSQWPLLGRSEQAVWGECKGSGKTPYRTQIDLAEPAFRCSCPSRKFPCKHGLGLFLLLTERADAFQEAPPPDWVTEWLEKRSHSAQRKQTKATKAAAPEAQAKRAQQRATKVAAGLVDLEQWLQDMVNQGLAPLPNQPYRFWDQAAARLVDAQAPGLAQRVRSLASIPHSGNDWPKRMLRSLGLLHLLVQGYQRIETLSPAMQAEVRSQIGWIQTQDELRRRAEQGDPSVNGEKDIWQVMGKVTFEEDNLTVQRTWLLGYQTQKPILILNFAHGSQPLDISLVPGTCFVGELILYPGTGIRRAFVVSREAAVPQLADNVVADQVEVAFSRYAQALSQNPWLGSYPMILGQVQPVQQDMCWWVQDTTGHVLPLSAQFQNPFELLAISGGHPLTVFGEWNGAELLPLSVLTETQFLAMEN